MTIAVGLANLILGIVYTSYGLMTVIDMKREWRTLGFSHFGAAWIAMAFTCGPHHADHGLHILFGTRAAGGLDLLAVLVGFPAGATWFLLRIEAFTGRRGDRFISGTPRWLSILPTVAAAYLAILMLALIRAQSGAAPGAGSISNFLLIAIYMTIGYFLLRTQLRNRPALRGWSVSGLALTVVFPTCALMHEVYLVYVASGFYARDAHGLVIDWLSVPAGLYFLWVVRALYVGSLKDWNEAEAETEAETSPAVA